MVTLNEGQNTLNVEMVPVPVGTSFSYTVLAAYICSLPQAPVWRTPGITCRISNPSAQPVTRNVKYKIQAISGTANNFEETFSLTLPAGGSVDWFFNCNRDGMTGYYKYAMGNDAILDEWLEDDGGGKSAVIRLPGGSFGTPYCTYLL